MRRQFVCCWAGIRTEWLRNMDLLHFKNRLRGALETRSSALATLRQRPFGPFALMMDVAEMFHGKARETRVVRDGTHVSAASCLTSTENVELFVKGGTAPHAPNATATPYRSGGIVILTMCTPECVLQMSGPSAAFTDLTMAPMSQNILETHK